MHNSEMTPEKISELLHNLDTPGPWTKTQTDIISHGDDTIGHIDDRGVVQSVVMPQDEQGGPSWVSDGDAEFITSAPDIAAFVDSLNLRKEWGIISEQKIMSESGYEYEDGNFATIGEPVETWRENFEPVPNNMDGSYATEQDAENWFNEYSADEDDDWFRNYQVTYRWVSDLQK